MKKSPRRDVALSILGVVAVAAVGLWYAKRIGVGEADFIEAMKNPLLEDLRKSAKHTGLKVSQESSGLSALLYDVRFENQPLDLLPWLKRRVGGRASVTVRFGDSIPSVLSLKTEALVLADTQITVRDQDKRPLWVCKNQACGTGEFKPSRASSVVEVSWLSSDSLAPQARITLQPAPAALSWVRRTAGLQKVELKLSMVEQLNFRTLTKSAAFIAKRGGYTFPSNKIMAEISVDGGPPSQARIGVSGRTEGHFTFPPSMGVTVDKGSPILGGSKFKLIRLEQRAGIVDFVTRSLLSNAEVLLPDQHLVRFFINGEYKGLYLFEDNYSEAFFENMGVKEGSVAGYDLDAFFRDYPQKIRLKSHFTHRPSGVKDPDAESRLGLELPGFADAIDARPMARLLAFVSLTRGTHGLGADDLRFYRDEETGLYEPIVRDLNSTFEPLSGTGWNHEVAQSMGFWTTQRLPSLSPLLQLAGKEPPQPLSLKEGLQFWDVHPQVLYFLKRPDARALFERYLLEYALNTQLSERIAVRARHLEEEISAWISPTEKSLIHAQVQALNSSSTYLLDEWLRQSIASGGPIIKPTGAGQAVLTNRLPLGVAIQHPDPTTRFSCGQKLSPFWNHLTPEVASSVIEVSDSICTAQWKTGKSFEEWAQGLKANLANGTALTPAFARPTPPTISTQNTGPTRVLFALHRFEQTQSETRVDYVVHTNGKFPYADPQQIIWRDMETLNPVAVNVTRKRVGNSRMKGRTEELDSFPVGWEKFVTNPSQFVAANSEVWSFRFPRITQPLYLRLEHPSVQQAFPGTEVLVLNALENYLAPAGSSSPELGARLSSIARPKPGTQDYVLSGKVHEIDSVIRIAPGESLEVQPGARLVMGSRGGLLVQGVLKILGTSSRPVEIGAKGHSWLGISFQNSKGENRIEHAHLSRAVRLRTPRVQAGGGLSLSGSTLTVSGSRLQDFLGPSAISAFRSELNLTDSEITGTKLKPLDLEFSWGSLRNTRIHAVARGPSRLVHSYFRMKNSDFGGVDTPLMEKSTLFVEDSERLSQISTPAPTAPIL